MPAPEIPITAVAPRVGAGIEILWIATVKGKCTVAPRVGAGSEIKKKRATSKGYAGRNVVNLSRHYPLCITDLPVCKTHSLFRDVQISF